MKIENKEIKLPQDYLRPVSYVIKDEESNSYKRGVIISFSDEFVKVLYCESRTVQSTRACDLVWG